MVQRLVAALLVVLLAWSSVGGLEPVSASGASQTWIGPSLPVGSVLDHHLDDMPSPPSPAHAVAGDLLGDPQDLIVDGHSTAALHAVPGWRRTPAHLLAAAPFLDPPSPPPRG